MKESIMHLVSWYQDTLASGGYPLVALLMAMESSILPVPSEFVIPFAAQRAHQTGGLNLWGIVLAGTIGSWVGATIMYWVARWAGRPLVTRYGGYFRVTEAKLRLVENWASRFGSFGVFAARMLPVVRHLIGIPAGIVKMDFRWYSFSTLLGSAIWCSVLVWVGVKAGDDLKLLKGDMREITLWLAGALTVLGFLYYFLVHRYMTTPATSSAKEL
jgi:membrane protein DedA with SNARE-associated domain